MPRGKKKVVEQAVAVFDGIEGIGTEIVEKASTVIEKEPVVERPARKGGRPRKIVVAETAPVAEAKPARKGGRPRKNKPIVEPDMLEAVTIAAASDSEDAIMPAVVDEPLSQETVVEAIVSEERTGKPRKAYPGHDERIALADKQIGRLSKLNAEREALIKATEEKLAVRKAALEKSYEAAKQAIAKKERLIAAKEKAAMSAVEKTAKKAEEKLKMNKLMDALKARGKSIDELLDELTHKDE